MAPKQTSPNKSFPNSLDSRGKRLSISSRSTQDASNQNFAGTSSSSSTAVPKQASNPTHSRIAELSCKVDRLAIHKEHCKSNDFKEVHDDLGKMQSRLEKVESALRKTMLPRLTSVARDFQVSFESEKQEARRGLEDEHEALTKGIEKTFMMLLDQERDKRREHEQDLITRFDVCLSNLRDAIAKEHDITEKEQILRLHLDRDLPRLRKWRQEETELREGMEATIVEHASKRIKELTDALGTAKAARLNFFNENRQRLEEFRDDFQMSLAQERVQRQAGEAMLLQLVKHLDGQIHLEERHDDMKDTLQQAIDRYGTMDQQIET